MSVFDTALATLHADANMAIPADYRRGGNGIPVRIRIVRSTIVGDEAPLGMRIKAREDVVSVRLVDAPHLAKDDHLTVDPDSTPTILVVTSAELDAEGRSFTATVRRV